MALDATCELLALDAAKAEALRGRQPDLVSLERAAGGAKALSDPTRRGLAIALRDADDECCVCDLAFVLGRQDKLVSHHLRLLRAAGLARSRKDGRMVLYGLTDYGRELLEGVVAFADVSGAGR